jgi:hypothetical protein
MAGLADFKFDQKMEDEPTSSVPKNKSDYAEPYEPSALKGVAGLALAGAGAVALRSPFGRAINKLKNLRTPKAPVPRITEPVDEVEEVLSIVPTKMDRGKAMMRPQTSQQEQIRQEAIQMSNELKKIAYNNPLSRGGKTNRIGSSLWDFIARHPVSGARKPIEWIKDFKSNATAGFKTGNPEFKNISQAVKKDELWDSNIAQFDKSGNLIGGFLKVAQEKNIPLTKMDLLYIVEKAPVNNLKLRKYRSDISVVNEAEDVSRQLDAGLSNISTKAIARQANNPSDEINQLVEDIGITQKSILKTNAKLNNQLRVVENEDFDSLNNLFDNDIEHYKTIVERARRLGVEVDETDALSLINFAKGKNTDFTRRLGLQKTQGMFPRYGNYNEYRIKGGDEYFEDVVYYPKNLPMGQKLPGGFNSHYSGVPNQVYHIRGSIRKGGGENQKVMMIDEIQSDYNQKLRNFDPTRSKVRNAFGAEVEFFSSNRKLEKMLAEMREFTKKGIYVTNQEVANFRKLKSEFDELRSNSMNLSNITSQEAKDGIPFLPLYGKENWGSHALKNVIKNAADEGVDWVAISPVERLHHAKRTKFLGDIEFYGTRTGKAGFKDYGGEQGVMTRKKNGDNVPLKDKDGNFQKTDPNKTATLPAEMNRLAKQYNSEVKTIPVAKSDPDKPYKVIKKVDVNEKYKLDKNSAGTEHEVAFATEKEALYYSGRYGGDVEKIMKGDPRLYFDAYAIRVNKEMADKPFKAYNTGGLVVNIFA